MSATIRKARLGDEFAANCPQTPMAPKVTIVPAAQRVVVSGREKTGLKVIADMRAEIGRMNKLADQLEAEFLRTGD